MIDEATRTALLDYIRPRFRLAWGGHHGISHWTRVESVGLALAAETGANARVVSLFALFHDACRIDEYDDPRHGARGAGLAGRLHGVLFDATDAEMALLVDACTGHSDGHLEADVTVQTCWDADRLDLPRVGVRPLPRFLCTEAARRRAVVGAARPRPSGPVAGVVTSTIGATWSLGDLASDACRHDDRRHDFTMKGQG